MAVNEHDSVPLPSAREEGSAFVCLFLYDGPMTTQKTFVLLLLLIFLPRVGFAGTATFSWTANPEESLAGYRLYYDIDSGDPYEGDFIAQGPSPIEILLEDLDDPDNPEVTIHGVPTCVHVFFALTAFDTDGQESDYSDEVETTIGTPPAEVAVVTGGAEGELSITWRGLEEDDPGSVASYRVHYGFEPGEPYDGTGAIEGDSPIDVDGASTSLLLTGLTPGTTVYVRVESVCSDGTTESAEEVSGDVAVPACGNEILETGETCDPPASCPSFCDDANSCTADILEGSAASCDAVCRVETIEDCIHGDDCCPSGCVHDTDDDCSRTCGDGTVDDGETCDPPETCPVSCEEDDPCVSSTLTGSADNCNAVCSSSPVAECIGGDGCCPSTCSFADDSDCSESCGNGEMEEDELCDPPSTCPVSCESTGPCSVGVLTGHPSNCNSQCTYSTIAACTDDDGCCPRGCTDDRDSDCRGDVNDGGPTVAESLDHGGCTCKTAGSAPTSLPLGALVVSFLLLLVRRTASTGTDS